MSRNIIRQDSTIPFKCLQTFPYLHMHSIYDILYLILLLFRTKTKIIQIFYNRTIHFKTATVKCPCYAHTCEMTEKFNQVIKRKE